jgi:hypothetical protein
MKSPRRPTIDTDLQQVSEEIVELRVRLTQYLGEKKHDGFKELNDRYFALLFRQIQLRRVISQRNKEHQEPTR